MNDADAQLRACYLSATSVVFLILMSLPTIVLLALANAFDCGHDGVVIIGMLVGVLANVEIHKGLERDSRP